jgi:hypothetical protein
MTMTSKVPPAAVQRWVRNQFEFANVNQVWVWAGAPNFRRLRSSLRGCGATPR